MASPIAPEQTTAFLAAIGLLGPRSLEDIRQAGLATLAPPPERRAAYDALFRIHFLGGEGADDRRGRGRRDACALQEERRGEDEPPLADEVNESGQAAARAEALVERRFSARRRRAKRCAGSPARRRAACRGGAAIGACGRGAAPCVDLRRTLRDSARNDGEVHAARAAASAARGRARCCC